MDIQSFIKRIGVSTLLVIVSLPVSLIKADNNQTLLSTYTSENDSIKMIKQVARIPYTVKSQTLSYGNLSLTDTYLSNIEYFGWNINYEGSLTGFYSSRIYWRSIATLIYGNTINLPATSTMSYVGGEISYGIGYNRYLDRLNLKLGALPVVRVGFKNNARNVNNIFSVDASMSLWLDAEVTYKIPLKRLKLAFTEQLQTSLLGGMFVPEFGALYYEYSLGNWDGTLHFSSFHNKVALKNRLEVSLALRKMILKAQYYINYQKWNANNLYFKQIQHNFGLGLVMLLENTTSKY